MTKNKKLKFIRWGILAIILIIITVEAYLHQAKGGGEAASIHALCPYGGLESLYSLLASGTLIQKIFSGTMILLLISVILVLLFRRSFCGLICPFGALQEFFGLLGKKLFKKNFKINARLDNYLRYLKYAVLLLTLYYAWKTAGLWVSPYDPWTAYGHLSEGFSSLVAENLIGFILLIVTLVASILYDRFFCKYLCPMGAIYGIISKVSPHKIVRNEDKCINCGLCSKSCPMNIDVAKSSKITSAECINCQLCVLSCPKEGCLETKHASRKLRPAAALSLVIVLFFGGIFISKLSGIYNTLPAPIPASKIISVDEIKGYMTLKEVANGLKIDVADLYKKLGIPADVPEVTKFKEVKNYVPGFTDEKAKDVLRKSN